MDTSNVTETQGDELFMHIPLEQLTASRFQPASRKPDADLVESVRQHGVVTPGLARPTPDGPTAYEVVFGHCRWAAAAAAELPSMPFVVRELDDVTALELMLVENLRRSDLHPMDEAEGYHQLHEQHGQAVEQIADRVGKSKAYVYARLKLLALQTEGRDAFRAGDIDASVALYLARVPGSLQSMALQKLCDGANRQGERVSARSAAFIIQRGFMLELDRAPFTTSDEDLVPEAGSCTDCLKRTGNQRELFADVESADVCTDPVCYRRKVDALWTIRTTAAKAEGTQILSEKTAKELWPNGSGYMNNREWLDLNDPCYSVAGSKPYKKLLAKNLPEVTLARDPDGNVRELVKRAAAEKALVELGLVKKTSSGPSRPKKTSKAEASAAVGKVRTARVLAEKVSHVALAAIIEAAEKAPFKPAVWLLLARDAVNFGGMGAQERRGFGTHRELELAVPKMTEGQLRGVILEATLWPDGPEGYGDKVEQRVVDACKAFGVDLKAIEKKVKAELDAAAKMPADLKAKPVKGKKK